MLSIHNWWQNQDWNALQELSQATITKKKQIAQDFAILSSKMTYS